MVGNSASSVTCSGRASGEVGRGTRDSFLDVEEG